MIVSWQIPNQTPAARVYDATGTEHLAVIWLDDVTGELERYLTDKKGAVMFDSVDHNQPLKERKFVPAPIVLVG